jgi:hypothetical protein
MVLILAVLWSFAMHVTPLPRLLCCVSGDFMHKIHALPDYVMRFVKFCSFFELFHAFYGTTKQIEEAIDNHHQIIKKSIVQTVECGL